MLADPALSASPDGDTDARRGPALWEGHAARMPILATILPVIIVVGLFATILILSLLSPGPRYARIRIPGGWEQVAIDPAAAMLVPVALLVVGGVLLVAVGMASLRAARQRYRIDGLAVEMAADGVIDAIAIPDVRRASVHPMLGGYRVRIIGARRQRIDLQLGTGDAARALAVLRGLGVECGALDLEEVPPVHDRLVLGEPVRWRGRPGLASFDAIRMIAATGILLPFAIFLGCLAWLWSSHPHPILGLMLTGGILALFGWPSMAILITFGGRLHHWLRDALGSVVVTDRRIAWATPLSGRFYRERMLADIEDVVMVEQRGRRAWLALTIRDGAESRLLDLRGVPRVDHFLMALGRFA